MYTSSEAEALVDAIRQHAWNSSVSLEQIPSRMKSMILWPEQKLLHWLTREYFKGEGCIGDLGCFVGSSTMSLASGLGAREESKALEPRPLIHSYDMFIAPDDPYTLQRLPEGYGPDSRFRDVFDKHTEASKQWIEVHDGDLRAFPWTNGSIEVLFIDICKCWSTNQAVLQGFFPHLVPGHSIIVHQDFVRVWNPWIPVTMAALGDYFEVLTEVESSRVYRCIKPIPPELVETDFRQSLSLGEKRRLLESSIEASSPKTAATHEGALAMLEFMEGSATKAKEYLEQITSGADVDEEVSAVYKVLRETMEYWKTGEAYEQEMEGKF